MSVSGKGRPMKPTVYCLTLLALGCSAEVDATNPFDPATAAASQERASLSGRLLAPEAFAASVFADAQMELRAHADGAALVAEVGETGGFEFAEVPAGSHTLITRVGGLQADPLDLQLAIGERREGMEIHLAVPREPRAFGTVKGVAQRQGRGPGQHLGIWVQALDTAFGTSTGPEGDFALELPARAEAYTLEIGAEGYEAVQLEVRAEAGAVVAVGGGEPQLLNAQPGTLTGAIALERLAVADHRGDIEVDLSLEGAETPSLNTSVQADGTFTTELAPGTWRVQARLEGFRPAHALAEVPPGGVGRTGTLLLRALGARVRGRVLLQGAEAHTGTRVRSLETGVEVQTNAEGAFELELVARRHTIRAVPPVGFVLPEAERDRVVELEAGAEVELPELRAQPLRTATLSGTLRSPLSIGDWPDRSLVEVSAPGLRRLATVLNGEDGGAFEISGLEPGDYHLSIQVRGHRSVFAALVLPAEGLSLEPIDLAPEPVELLGAVVDPRGDPVPDVVVRARRGERLAGTTLSAPDGAFGLVLTPETHTLALARTGYAPREVIVDWAEGFVPQEGELAIVLQPLPSASLSGRLRGAVDVDDWASRAVLSLTSEDEAVQRVAPALRDGRFQFAGVPPGAYELSVFARGHQPHTQAVQLMDGENGPLEIALLSEVAGEDAFMLRGVARLGGPAQSHEGITVRGVVRGNLVFTTTTDPEGRFVAPIARDTHTLSFSRAGYGPAEGELSWLPEQASFTYGGAALEGLEVLETLPALNVASLRGVLRSPLPIDDWPARSLVAVFGDGVQRLATVSPEEGGGRYEVAGLRPGAYSLSVQVAGHQPRRIEVEVPEAGRQLDVALLPNEVLYEGTVEDPIGAVEGARVRAHIRGNEIDTTITDAEGRFTLALIPESHTLTITHPSYLAAGPIHLDWEAGAHTLREGPEALRLQPVSGQLRVTVSIEPSWIPEHQRVVRVRVVGEGVERVEARVGDEAPVVFAELEAGTYVVIAERDGFERAEALVVLDEGSPQPDLRLEVALTSLDGAALDLRGAPLTDADLRALPTRRGANLSGVVLVPAEGDVVQLCGLDLSGVTMVGTNLDGVDLTGARLAGANLSNASLAGADLGGADLTGATLFGANLQGAAFVAPEGQPGAEGCAGLDFEPTRFDSVNLSSANLSEAVFRVRPAEGADCEALRVAEPLDLTGVDFAGANLSRANLSGVDLSDVDLSSALFVGADLRGAVLDRASLVLSDLSDADFRCAHLEGSSLLASVLLRSDFEDAVMPSAVLTEAVIEETSFVGANLEGARLIGVLFADADLTGAELVDADLRNAEFVDAVFSDGRYAEEDFAKANLSGASLQNSNLSSANLRGVSLVGTLLRGADLSAANLRKADLTRADLTGARLVGANLVDTILTEAELSDVTLQGTNPGRRAFYSFRTRWPAVVPVAKLQTDPCALRFETEYDWPEGEEPPRLVPAQAHFLHPCTNLSGEARDPEAREENEALGIDVRPLTDLSGADLSGVDLRKADLKEAVLRNADLRGTDLRDAVLSGADLVGTILREPQAQLRGADLRAVDLIEQDLSGFDLTLTSLREAHLNEADLRGASLVDAQLQAADLNGAKLEGVDLTRAQISGETTFPDDFDPLAEGAIDQPLAFVRIAPGTFVMSGADDHTIILTRPFLIQVTEVAPGEWAALMGGPCPSGENGPCKVSFWDALRYLNALSDRENLTQCYDPEILAGPPGNRGANWDEAVYQSERDCDGYRLPTEAEWEYAARAGTEGPLDAEAFGEECLNQAGRAPPAAHTPNAWGVYDMIGNVGEWVDGFSRRYLDEGAIDPIVHHSNDSCLGRAASNGFMCDLDRRGGYSCDVGRNAIRPARLVRSAIE